MDTYCKLIIEEGIFLIMSNEDGRIRVRISKKKYDKIDKYARKKGLKTGSHIIDDLMCDFIDKKNL